MTVLSWLGFSCVTRTFPMSPAQQVYEQVAEPILTDVLNGYSGCILACEACRHTQLALRSALERVTLSPSLNVQF